MHAERMKSPQLLVHGEADNNTGAYHMLGDPYFNALKGLGATARLVMLENESHGYVAKEGIPHHLWEQNEWLDKQVKQAGLPVNLSKECLDKDQRTYWR